MNCIKCGYLNYPGANFCVGCGISLKLQAVADHDTTVLISPPEEKKKRPVSKKILAVILSCSVVGFTAVVVIVMLITIHMGRVSDYENAVMLMEDGKHELALELFDELKGFRDAVELAVECRNYINYEEARRLFSIGEYSQAKLVFIALDDYKESAVLAVECQKHIDYNNAAEIMRSGDYEKARELFLSLGSFLNSASLVAECDNNLAYQEAVILMESGEYAQAVSILEPLVELRFPDSLELLEICNYYISYNEAIALMGMGKYEDAQILLNPLASFDFEDSLTLFMECIYAQADAAYTEGLFYAAYVLFRDIIGYKDSRSRAESCIQDNPPTGELFRNSDFSGRAVSVRVRTPRDQVHSTFVKVYTEDGIHVSSLFIRGGDSPTLRIPTGTYMFRAAYGENWFGEEEMFGDEGHYETLIIDNATTYRIRSNYTYTLTLGGVTDGNVGSQNESRSDF
jgi:tetratricopeptide (TPR) repeat protein